MCSIFGALLTGIDSVEKECHAESILNFILKASQARGRDGYGWSLSLDGLKADGHRVAGSYKNPKPINLFGKSNGEEFVSLLGNFRAEPTTEYVLEKRLEDQQPYKLNAWTIVHNGTIANDNELRTGELNTSIDSAAIVEALSVQSSLFNTSDSAYSTFQNVVKKIVGSYAIIARHTDHPDCLFIAANYRPLWISKNELGVFFASTKEYFPDEMTPVAIEPYSSAMVKVSNSTGVEITSNSLRPKKETNGRALVIASGGLDSTVAAAQCIKDGYEVELLHFVYGCRAEAHEEEAITAIANKMEVPVTIFPLSIYDPSDSRLFDESGDIAGGEAGAEFAHEWVPARNLVMLSVATAFAEAKGFDVIVLGNNMEEAGAYPDNEPEFIRRFNEVLPFAVGANKQVRVIMPVGDLMKHEIVKMGFENGAPMELTWSCYKNGNKHCGKCGPCFMRRTAFEINNINEVIEYEE